LFHAQLATASTSTNAKTTSSGVTIPVQHEKSSSRTIPIQKVNGTSKSSSGAAADIDADNSNRVEELDKTFRAERAGFEESHRLKVKALEEQVTRAKKESEKIALESKTALAEVRSRYEKELDTWTKDRDQL